MGFVRVGVGWGGPRYRRGCMVGGIGGGEQWMGPSICGYVGMWVGGCGVGGVGGVVVMVTSCPGFGKSGARVSQI